MSFNHTIVSEMKRNDQSPERICVRTSSSKNEAINAIGFTLFRTNLLVLSVVFVLFLLLQVSLFAQTQTAPAVGDGSDANPYQIATVENLFWLQGASSAQSKSIIQTADIDASAYGWGGIASFTGKYDGQGHTINGLHGGGAGSGFFKSINSGAVVANLHLTNINFSSGYGQNYDGGFASMLLSGSTITGCSITGTLQGHDITDRKSTRLNSSH